MSIKPVMVSGLKAGSILPEEGSQCMVPENNIMSIIPNQNMGTETPTSERSIPPLSNMEFFFTAEITPTLTPKS